MSDANDLPDDYFDEAEPMNFAGWNGNIVEPPSPRIATDGHSIVLLERARAEAVVLATERQDGRPCPEATVLELWHKLEAESQVPGASCAVSIGPEVWSLGGALYLSVHRTDGQLAHMCPLKHITLCGVIQWDCARQGKKPTDAVVYFLEGRAVAAVMPMNFDRAKWAAPDMDKWTRLAIPPAEGVTP